MLNPLLWWISLPTSGQNIIFIRYRFKAITKYVIRIVYWNGLSGESHLRIPELAFYWLFCCLSLHWFGLWFSQWFNDVMTKCLLKADCFHIVSHNFYFTLFSLNNFLFFGDRLQLNAHLVLFGIEKVIVESVTKMPGICARCQKTVYFNEEKIAIGKSFHVMCFVCGQSSSLIIQFIHSIVFSFLLSRLPNNSLNYFY